MGICQKKSDIAEETFPTKYQRRRPPRLIRPSPLISHFLLLVLRTAGVWLFVLLISLILPGGASSGPCGCLLETRQNSESAGRQYRNRKCEKENGKRKRRKEILERERGKWR